MNPYLWIDHLNYQLMFHLPLPPSTSPPIPTPSPPDYSERNPSLHMIPPTGNLSLNLLQKTGGVVCSSNFSTSLRHQGYWGDFIIYFLFIYNWNNNSRVKITAKDIHTNSVIDEQVQWWFPVLNPFWTVSDRCKLFLHGMKWKERKYSTLHSTGIPLKLLPHPWLVL